MRDSLLAHDYDTQRHMTVGLPGRGAVGEDDSGIRKRLKRFIAASSFCAIRAVPD